MTTRLDTETRDALLSIAHANDRTIAAELRRAVRFYLERANEAA